MRVALLVLPVLLALAACRRDPRHRPDAAVVPMVAASPGSLAGGKVTLLVATGVAAPVLAVDAGWVYWITQPTPEQSRLMRMPKGGGPALVVLESFGTWVPELAVSGGSLFLVGSDGNIMKVAKSGGRVVPEVTSRDGVVPFVAASDAKLFWTHPNGVASKVLPAGEPEPVWSGEWGAFSPVAAGDAVYWASRRGPQDSELWGRVPGQPPQLLAKDHGEASVLAVEGDWLYWLTERSTGNPKLDGELWRVPRAGGTASVVTQGGFMHELTAWDGLVYLARFNGPDRVEVVELEGAREHVLLRPAQIPQAMVRDVSGLYIVLGGSDQQGQIVRISR